MGRRRLSSRTLLHPESPCIDPDDRWWSLQKTTTGFCARSFKPVSLRIEHPAAECARARRSRPPSGNHACYSRAGSAAVTNVWPRFVDMSAGAGDTFSTPVAIVGSVDLIERGARIEILLRRDCRAVCGFVKGPRHAKERARPCVPREGGSHSVATLPSVLPVFPVWSLGTPWADPSIAWASS